MATVVSKGLLHTSRVNAFMRWLDGKGIPHRRGVGEYQVLQVRIGHDWCGVYWRHNMPEHYTTDRRLDRVVAAFCRDDKQTP